MASVSDSIAVSKDAAKKPAGDGADDPDPEPEAPKEMVPFHKLFRYADGWDMVLIGFGLLMSIAQGAMMPAPV